MAKDSYFYFLQNEILRTYQQEQQMVFLKKKKQVILEGKNKCR